MDQDTNRGVPLVELTTVSKVRFVTDSNGWVAFREPGLMDREVFFEVKSHGYSYPQDGFGSRGKILRTTPGERVVLKVVRENMAERLYRVTGEGIYRDSWLLGVSIPIEEPLLNGDVVGQDTVQTAVVGERLYWFWGDTNRPRYPLGQFKTSGAISRLSDDGGLDPLRGVNLNYFVDESGFSRPMTPVEGPGAVWLHGLFTLDGSKSLSMFGHYSRVKSLGEQYEHGLLQYDFEEEVFRKLKRFDDDAMLYPRGQALYGELGLEDYIYFCRPFPSVRVRADVDAIADPTSYEAYTCLLPGKLFDHENPEVEINNAGEPVWAWKRNTDAIDARRLHRLVELSLVSSNDAVLALRDEGELVWVDSGSVHWNEYRKKWVMIAEQLGGKRSFLGEIWYAESDALEGPWVNARLIVSHDRYSFYNPAHHPFFDQGGGRVILFEGTYVTTFSQTKTPTPRYDYNQIMYSLDLSDPRLSLD